MFVPVISKSSKPLMPTKPNKAGMLIKKKLATPFWRNGIFCIRLNYEPKTDHKQEVAIGIDPGSKKEGFCVKSKENTYLNLQADAHVSTKKKIAKRKNLRRARRNRKTRCRKCRCNRKTNKKFIPPSTRARWSWKVRIVDQLLKIFPITACVIEDVQAETKKGKKRWNQSFSPLQVGKKWFYEQMEERFEFFDQLKGWETKQLRERYSLHKLDYKLSSDFHAHCVDAWVLATHAVGGYFPNNKDVLCIRPLLIQRRCLHKENPKKGGIRTPYGGTRCIGFTKGTLIKSVKYGLGLIGGVNKRNKLRLVDILTRKNITLACPPNNLKIKTRLNWLICN